MWYSFITILMIVVLAALTLTILSWRRPELGTFDGKLKDCGPHPNCVCSNQDGDPHFIEPLRWTKAESEGIARLEKVIGSFPNVKILTKTENYLRVEFITPVMRYVDDVEFLVDSGRQVIHYRSASRVGRSDLGANRRRMMEFRRRFEGQ